MNFNNICILCSENSMQEDNNLYILCEKCQKLLNQQFLGNLFKNNCPHCCSPILSNDKCVNCSDQTNSYIEKKHTCFSYTGIIKELITYYKFRNLIQLKGIFSEYILKALGDFSYHIILIPIPGNPKNIKKRGWDQVLEIANWIKHDRIVVHKLLKQRKKHKQQKKLDKFQRISQTRNKYSLDSEVLNKVLKDLQTFEVYQILLIDDIITTGATLESAAAVIIDTLKVPIHAITLAMD
ncbi:MAG: ComF family protein [Spirochaetia bacterium]|nr:ComF family protein [Spirochaetia bacterium]